MGTMHRLVEAFIIACAAVADFELGLNFSPFHGVFREIWQNIVLAPPNTPPRGSTPPAQEIFYPELTSTFHKNPRVQQIRLFIHCI